MIWIVFTGLHEALNRLPSCRRTRNIKIYFFEAVLVQVRNSLRKLRDGRRHTLKPTELEKPNIVILGNREHLLCISGRKRIVFRNLFAIRQTVIDKRLDRLLARGPTAADCRILNVKMLTFRHLRMRDVSRRIIEVVGMCRSIFPSAASRPDSSVSVRPKFRGVMENRSKRTQIFFNGLTEVNIPEIGHELDIFAFVRAMLNNLIIKVNPRCIVKPNTERV